MKTPQRKVQLDEDDVAWFKETYPGASLSWILSVLLKKYREVHKLGPLDYAELGARATKEIIQSS